jgi:hypothetical protein
MERSKLRDPHLHSHALWMMRHARSTSALLSVLQTNAPVVVLRLLTNMSSGRTVLVATVTLAAISEAALRTSETRPS